MQAQFRIWKRRHIVVGGRRSGRYRLLSLLWSKYPTAWIVTLFLATTLYFHFPREYHDPKGTWIALLEAMRNRDEHRIRALTTSAGWESLSRLEPDASKTLEYLQFLAEEPWFHPEELRWPYLKPREKELIGVDAIAKMGWISVTSIGFKKTSQGWKVNAVWPGD